MNMRGEILSNIGILFDGQGGQFKGMGQDFYVKYPEIRYMYQCLANRLNMSVQDVFQLDNEKIKETRLSQPLIFTFEAAISRLLPEKNMNRKYYGLSLGMYSAFLLDGAASFEILLDIILHRAKYMQDCSENQESNMNAIFTTDFDLVETICSLFSENQLDIANLNSTDQVVIGGTPSATKKAIELFESVDIPHKELNVSGAFHTKLMSPAASKFSSYLKENNTFLKAPSENVITDKTLKEYRADYVLLCSKQIENRTNFVDVVKQMKNSGIDFYLEIGPKRTLAKFMNKIIPDATVTSITSVDDLTRYRKEMGD